ncbi:hypothetical protein V5F57_27520, partial [Xanthobacter aminoxidans]
MPTYSVCKVRVGVNQGRLYQERLLIVQAMAVNEVLHCVTGGLDGADCLQFRRKKFIRFLRDLAARVLEDAITRPLAYVECLSVSRIDESVNI